MPHLFISYSRKDFPVVDRLRNDLRNAGIRVWIDKVGLTPGTLSWEQALRDAIRDADAVLFCASLDSRESPYVRDEIALAKQANKPIFPAWVAGDTWLDCVPIGLGGAQYADLRGDHYATGLLQLVAAIRGEATTISPLIPEEASVAEAPPDFVPRNPYKGLRAFRESDQQDFFGCGTLVADLLTQVEDPKRAVRLLAVLGASGSGKSSVIMAGLLPKLREKHPDWVLLAPMVPGTQPLENLAGVLVRQIRSRAHTAILEDLKDASTRGLHRLGCEIGDNPVVLYIDQFEEIFTQAANEAERRQFIDLLSTAVTEPNGALVVVLSMRADFYDRALQFTPFGKLVETYHAAITPMTLADLYDVVQKPAALPEVRLTFDEGLVTEMVFAVREETAALPLLQFTLDQLFERRYGGRLTLNAYREMGGIQGALARQAEATYQNLPSEQYRPLARALFLRLIEPGQTEQDTTRRRATYSELTLPDPEQTRILQETADAFVDARLLVSDSPHAEGVRAATRTLEVSHEALIREWKRLGEWLHAAREDLRLQKSLTADVAEWKRRGSPADMLYRGTVLTEAQAWTEYNTANRDETLFLNESQRAETERQRREVTAARRIRYLAVIAMAVIVMAALSVALIYARNNADLRDEATTLQALASTSEYQSRYVEAQINWLATRQFPIAPAYLTQTPAVAFFATAMSEAELAGWQPVTEVFDGVEMALVPAGCFWIGSNSGNTDETPVHEICFDKQFWIDKYEVTNAQYGSVGCTDSSFEPNKPRNCVTWFDAHNFCQSRRARLPTEAEWEYAARGPDGLVYPWGNDFVGENVVYSGNSNSQTADVGSKRDGTSWIGALDMSGNVWEWTSSLYMDYPYSDDHESNSYTSGVRVLRGGSFNYATYDLRAANRNWSYPVVDMNDFGFRCARDYEVP